MLVAYFFSGDVNIIIQINMFVVIYLMSIVLLKADKIKKSSSFGKGTGHIHLFWSFK